jgi:fumarate reductase subunit D
MSRSNEPIWWSLFSGGGVVAALLMPVTIVLTGIAIPLGWLTPQRVVELVQHPLTRLYLFVVISLSLFHWAHRFKFTLVDLGLKPIAGLLSVACYGAAIAGTVLSVVFLVRI